LPRLQVCTDQTRLSLLKIPYTYTICEPEKACIDKYERCHAAIQSQQKQTEAELKDGLKSFIQQHPAGASLTRNKQVSFKKKSMTKDTKGCRDPHQTDPESWECECHEQMVAACPLKVSDKALNFLKRFSTRRLGNLKSFDTKCYRSRLCHNPTVCKSWKDKACSASEIHQFAEDEALFSAWAREHRARIAGRTNEDLDISAGMAASALDKDLSDNAALHTAAASRWTLTPQAPWTLTPTADQACFADPESFDCSCFEKMKRQCRNEGFRKQLELTSVNDCYEFFVCSHSQTCAAYQKTHCQSHHGKLRELQKQNRFKVETC